ncbi:YadA-like family protein, partial [Guyparkeria sp.]|uniref:YadA-like family protein n=1 Tax=Guyparkeria sp. TaxID=2035736 RepID=UPI003970B46D
TLGNDAYSPTGDPEDVAGIEPGSEVSVGSAGNERRITNLAAGAEDTDAVNVSQLKQVNEIASSGWNLQANDDVDVENIGPGETAIFQEGQNIAINREDNKIIVATADDVEFSNLDVTENLTVTGDTYLGDSFRITENEAFYEGPVTEETHVANKQYVDGVGDDLVGEGLNFTGNDNSAGDVHRDLGETLAITGGSVTAGGYSGDNLRTVTDPSTGEIRLELAESPQFGDVTINDGDSGRITGVADGVDGGDAVNLSQLDDVEALASTGWNLSAQDGVAENIAPDGEVNLRNADGNLLISRATENGREEVTFDLSDDVTIGNDLTVTGDTYLGDSFRITENEAFYEGPVTEETHVANKQYVDNSVTELGGTPLTFGGDSGETERRLGQRLDVVGGNTNLTTEVVDEETLEINLSDDLALDSVTINDGGPVITDSGIDMNDNQITNLAEGDVSENSTDAINGSQLYATEQWVQNLESNFSNIAGDSSNEYITNNGRGIRYVRTNDDGLAVSDAFAQAQGATAAGYEARATADRALALGYQALAAHEGSVALGEGARTDDAIGTDSVIIAGQTYQFAGTAPVATVSVGSQGAERTITHVAAGRVSAESTDAVNGSQLYAANQAIDGLDTRVTNVEGDISNINNDLADLDDRAVKYDTNDDGSVDYDTITLEGDGGTSITNVAAGEVSETSNDVVNGSQLWEVQNQITNIEQGGSKYFRANSDGPDADPQGADSIAMGPSSIAKGDGSVASGAGARAEADGSVALGSSAVADREGMNGERERFSNEAVASSKGAVSVGSEGNERQITNVAGGTQATDAVNVRQLDAVQRGSVNYDRDEGGNVDYNTITLEGEGGTTITNLAPGEKPTDAVNVGQLQQFGYRFEDQIKTVHERIDEVESNANAGIASALAAAGVPQAFMPGKSMIAVGAGAYKGESAVSVGMSRLSDNGRWIIKANVSGDSRGNVGAGVGAGWHW